MKDGQNGTSTVDMRDPTDRQAFLPTLVSRPNGGPSIGLSPKFPLKTQRVVRGEQLDDDQPVAGPSKLAEKSVERNAQTGGGDGTQCRESSFIRPPQSEEMDNQKSWKVGIGEVNVVLRAYTDLSEGCTSFFESIQVQTRWPEEHS